MNLENIQNLPINNLADKDCTLFMWTTMPLLKDSFLVLKSWGFQYKTVAFVWIKLNKKSDTLFWGMGHWTRSNAELCILATKGHPKRISASVHQVIMSHIQEHSKKPDETRDRIVELVGDLPRIELFARNKTVGWDTWGNEIECDINMDDYSDKTGGFNLSDNWVVQHLENALDTWNEKLSEIWTLLTQSPQDFKGGGIWNVIVNINGAVQAIGLALLVLFFVIGMVKTCSSFVEVKKPEHALKLFVRFALAKALVTYGMELMLALFEIVQGVISTIMNSAGLGASSKTTLPDEMVTAIENCGFFESIPLWAVTLIGSLFVTVLSFVLILTVYSRFFKLYMFTALAPIPLSTFAGEPTQNVGRSFIKAYCGVLLEGAVIILACIIFSLYASSPPQVDTSAAAVTMVWKYIGELVFNMLILVGTVKMADRIVHEMMGI